MCSFNTCYCRMDQAWTWLSRTEKNRTDSPREKTVGASAGSSQNVFCRTRPPPCRALCDVRDKRLRRYWAPRSAWARVYTQTEKHGRGIRGATVGLCLLRACGLAHINKPVSPARPGRLVYREAVCRTVSQCPGPVSVSVDRISVGSSSAVPVGTALLPSDEFSGSSCWWVRVVRVFPAWH